MLPGQRTECSPRVPPKAAAVADLLGHTQAPSASHALTVDVLLVHAKVVAAVCDQRAALHKAPRVQQHLAGGQGQHSAAGTARSARQLGRHSAPPPSAFCLLGEHTVLRRYPSDTPFTHTGQEPQKPWRPPTCSRSRAVSLPRSCCLATRLAPPPSCAARLAASMRSQMGCGQGVGGLEGNIFCVESNVQGRNAL